MSNDTGTKTVERETEWPFKIVATIVAFPAREAKIALAMLAFLCLAAGAIVWQLERVREAVLAK